jgi:hypothetical protein
VTAVTVGSDGEHIGGCLEMGKIAFGLGGCGVQNSRFLATLGMTRAWCWAERDGVKGFPYFAEATDKGAVTRESCARGDPSPRR